MRGNDRSKSWQTSNVGGSPAVADSTAGVLTAGSPISNHGEAPLGTSLTHCWPAPPSMVHIAGGPRRKPGKSLRELIFFDDASPNPTEINNVSDKSVSTITLDLIHSHCPASRVKKPSIISASTVIHYFSHRRFEWSVLPSRHINCPTSNPRGRSDTLRPKFAVKVSDIANLVVQPSKMWIDCVRWNCRLTLWTIVKLSEMIVVWCVHSIFVVWYALTLLFAAINLLCWPLVIINRC